MNFINNYIAYNFPLIVVLPLVFAVAIFAVKKHIIAFSIAVFSVLFSFVFACLILLQVNDQGFLSYTFGNWKSTIGIEYRIDYLNSIFLIIVNLLAVIILPWSYTFVKNTMEKSRIYLFYTLWITCITGVNGILVTGDLFNLFVFIEISSLSYYALVAMGSSKQSLTASFNYLMLGTIASSFYIIGICYLYLQTGNLNLVEVQSILKSFDYSNMSILVPFCFIMIALTLKSAIFPLHSWLPSVYSWSPDVISTFKAATGTKTFIYIMIRMLFFVFIGSKIVESIVFIKILQFFGFFGIVFGIYNSFVQNNIKKLLAWSSISQIGYIILALGYNDIYGLRAVLIGIFHHSLAKGLLFMISTHFIYRAGSVLLCDLRGISKSMKFSGILFLIGVFSMFGIPGTLGFISKLTLFLAIIKNQDYALLIVIALTSFSSILYLWKCVEIIYVKTPIVKNLKEVNAISLIFPSILAFLLVFLGVFGSFLINYVDIIANSIMNFVKIG